MKDETCYQVDLTVKFDDAVELVTAALKKEGFGILTRVDVRETLKQKLNVDFRPYLILGACNPSLAYKALSADPKVGLMLPCNVTLEAMSEGGVRVCFANPALMKQFVDDKYNPQIQEAAENGEMKIKTVLSALQGVEK